MARSINEIQAGIIASVQADTMLGPALTSTSKRAIWRLWTFIFAVAINILEQIMDVFKTNTDITVSLAAPQTSQWLQNMVNQFQYSATNPQILQLINLVPQYPIVDTSLLIVSRCSVNTSLAGAVVIKVATGNPPTALSSLQLSALQSYVNLIGVTGIDYAVISGSADKIMIQADVYYNGGYSSVISSNVQDAINNYLSILPFNGALKLTDLAASIRDAAGVTDVIFKNVVCRADTTSLASGTYLVTGNQYVGRLWPTVAGYIVGETTSGSTFSDTLNFIAE